VGGEGRQREIPPSIDLVDDVLEELHDRTAADEAGAREVAKLRGEQCLRRGDAVGDDGAEPGPGAWGAGDRDAPEVDDLHHRLEVDIPRQRRRHGVGGQPRRRHRGLTATLAVFEVWGEMEGQSAIVRGDGEGRGLMASRLLPEEDSHADG